MKKGLCLLLALAALITPAFALDTLPEEAITLAVPSAVLMEKTTGEVIYEKNAHEAMEPASVTKVMTMLLTVEAVEAGTISLDDTVTASAHAASMGGSQIWLEEGETMTVDEMLKCVAVVSANDCAVALAEHLAGSEEAFVGRMNQRAEELGMRDTHFTNCTGLLSDRKHLTTAYDIALMSRELISHELIKSYTTIWMDTARDGEFGLSNTNKLIYYYEGATGLKTGFTSSAMYCLSATAERDGVEYIAVVMHGATSDERFESAKTLLSYAFANYGLASLTPDFALPPVKVELGESDCVQPLCAGGSLLLEKSELGGLSYRLDLPESIAAPVEAGQTLGTVTLLAADGSILGQAELTAGAAVARLSFGEILLALLGTVAGRPF